MKTLAELQTDEQRLTAAKEARARIATCKEDTSKTDARSGTNNGIINLGQWVEAGNW